MTGSAVAVEPRRGDARNGNGTGDGGVPGRTIRRHTTLPGGRAVVGGFLVALAATAVFAAYTRATTTPEQRFVVARHTLAPGHHVTSADLALAPMRVPNGIAFRSVRPLIGSTVVGPIGARELVQPSSLLAGRGHPGRRQLSIPIDSSRAVSGDLRPGDRVDVAATFGSGADAYTSFVVRSAEVLARQQAGGTLGSHSSEVLVVALPSATDALAVAHAISVGQLSVVRATGADPATSEPYRAPAAPVIADGAAG
jgi:Flp pilus assembly protein CpaB